jgi:integrase
MELLGHGQMRTTMDVYGHVMPALAREATNLMGTVLLMRAASTATTDDSSSLPGGRPVRGVEPRGLEPLTGPHTARPS